MELSSKFPYNLTDKKQLQSLRMSELPVLLLYYKNLAYDRKILSNRLRKNNKKPLSYECTDAVRRINEKVKKLPILALPDDNNEKVIETDASEVGAESLNRYMIERKR